MRYDRFVFTSATFSIIKVSELGREHTRAAARAWQNFKVKHGTDDCCRTSKHSQTTDKMYDEEVEEHQRFILFAKTLKHVNEHNQRYENGEESHKLEMNYMADWVRLQYF